MTEGRAAHESPSADRTETLRFTSALRRSSGHKISVDDLNIPITWMFIPADVPRIQVKFMLPKNVLPDIEIIPLVLVALKHFIGSKISNNRNSSISTASEKMENE